MLSQTFVDIFCKSFPCNEKDIEEKFTLYGPQGIGMKVAVAELNAYRWKFIGTPGVTWPIYGIHGLTTEGADKTMCPNIPVGEEEKGHTISDCYGNLRYPKLPCIVFSQFCPFCEENHRSLIPLEHAAVRSKK
jgi:hypothetical protein